MAKHGRARAMGLGEAAMNKLYGSYIHSAKRRGYSFELSLDEFKSITSSSCYYCGAQPSNVARGHGKYQYNGDYKFNGIDRVDNTRGYTQNNCVPCCTSCNSLKRGVTPQIIERAYAFLLQEVP